MANSGLITIYDNTVPNKRMVTDRILFQDPYDIATYSYFGTDVSKFAFLNRDNHTYEWLNDVYEDRVDAVTTGLASSSTTTTCTVTTAALWQPGDVWLIGSEQVWVSAMTSAVATLTRGWAGTTKATHANASVATRISRARIDGDDADDSPSHDVTSTTNVTQILQRTINLTRSRMKVALYGIASPEDYEIDIKMKTLMMDLARIPYYGGTVSAGTENTVARRCGGFSAFISDNVTYATSTAATGGTALALTRKNIDDNLALIHADGGDPDLIFTTSWGQRKVNDMYEGFVSTERSEQLGGVLIKKLMNPITGRIMDVVVDRNCPSGQMWILTKDKIAFYAFDPFFYERLAKTGDAVKGEVVGEYGLIVANGKWHGAVKEFSESV